MIESISNLLYALFGKASLRAYESACLEAWHSTLTAPEKQKLDQQLRRFGLVQRSANDKLVTFHDLKDETYRTWAPILFANRLEGLRAASLFLAPLEQTTERLRAVVTVHRGRLFSIEFDRPPTALRRLTSQQLTTSELRVYADMDVSGTSPRIGMSDEKERQLPKWLHRLLAIAETSSPIDQTVRDKLLSAIDAKLPAEYLLILERTNGAKLPRGHIFAPAEIDTVIWPEANYYVFAHIKGVGDIAVEQGDLSGNIVILRPEDDGIPTIPSQSLIELLDLDLTR